jgi:hypothetical protein
MRGRAVRSSRRFARHGHVARRAIAPAADLVLTLAACSSGHLGDLPPTHLLLQHKLRGGGAARRAHVRDAGHARRGRRHQVVEASLPDTIN